MPTPSQTCGLHREVATTLTYRSVMEVLEDAQLERSVRSEVNAWLEQKGYDTTDLGPAWREIAPGTGAVWLEYPVGPDGTVRARLHLAEASGWGTRLTFSAGGNRPGWLWVDVHSPDGRQAKVPKLVRNLLPLVDAWDGTARLEERSKIVRPEDIPDLIDVLCDPLRRGVVFVAGTTAIQPESWRKLVDAVARDTIGLAATYLLDPSATVELETAVGHQYATPGGTIRTYLPEVDPASALDSRRHRILGAERLASSDVRDVRRLLADVARRQALGAALPRDVIKVDRLLDRLQTTELVSTWKMPGSRHAASLSAPVEVDPAGVDVTPVPKVTAAPDTVTKGPPVATPAEAPQSDRGDATTAPNADLPAAAELIDAAAKVALPLDPEAVNETGPAEVQPATPHTDVRSVETHLALAAGTRRIFGLDEPTPDLVDQLVTLAEQSLIARDTGASVQQRLEALQTRLEITEDREQRFADQADEAEQNFALSQYENNALADKVLYLQRALAQLDQAETAWSDVPEHQRTQRPDSFERLLDTASTLNDVVLTGSRDATIELDSHDFLGTMAGKAWDLLLVLQDYADTKKDGRCIGSLHEYLRNTPPGCRSYSANQYASAESDTVRQKANWHHERVFPVPESIDPNRQVFMESHFRLGAKKSVSPRVYVFDATRKDGRVYVGYIGRHLENTKS